MMIKKKMKVFLRLFLCTIYLFIYKNIYIFFRYAHWFNLHTSKRTGWADVIDRKLILNNFFFLSFSLDMLEIDGEIENYAMNFKIIYYL